MAGLEESQRDNRLMMKLSKSTRRWAASVITARLPAKYPPAERVTKHLFEYNFTDMIIHLYYKCITAS